MVISKWAIVWAELLRSMNLWWESIDWVMLDALSDLWWLKAWIVVESWKSQLSNLLWWIQLVQAWNNIDISVSTGPDDMKKIISNIKDKLSWFTFNKLNKTIDKLYNEDKEKYNFIITDYNDIIKSKKISDDTIKSQILTSLLYFHGMNYMWFAIKFIKWDDKILDISNIVPEYYNKLIEIDDQIKKNIENYEKLKRELDQEIDKWKKLDESLKKLNIIWQYLKDIWSFMKWEVQLSADEINKRVEFIEENTEQFHKNAPSSEYKNNWNKIKKALDLLLNKKLNK